VWGRDDASFVAATASPENSQKKRKKKGDLTDKASQNYTKHKTKPKRASGGGLGGPRGGGGGGGDLYGVGKGKDFIGIRSLWLLNE
jgi:hypothetical protein